MPTDLSSVSFYVAILHVFHGQMQPFPEEHLLRFGLQHWSVTSTSSSVNSSLERKLDILSVFKKSHAVIYLRSFLMLKEQ